MSRDDKMKNGSHEPLIEAFVEALHEQSSIEPDEVQASRARLVAQIRGFERVPVRISAPVLRPLFAAAAAVVALGLSLWMLVPSAEDPATKPFRPPRSQVAFNALWRSDAAAGLNVGTWATVPEGMGAKLQVSPGSAIWVGEHTTFALGAADGGELNLKGGKFLVAIAEGEIPSFKINTGLGEVVVHGTVFSVSSDNTETVVRLYEGSVALRSQGGRQFIEPGQSATINRDGAVVVQPLDMKGALADLLVAEPFVKHHGDNAPRVPDVLALAEGLTAQVELAKPAPPALVSPQRSKRRSSRVIEAAKAQIEVKRADTDSDIPVLERISETKEQNALFDEVESLYEGRDCQLVVEKSVEYIRKFPAGAHIDEVVYFKGYCQAYNGDLSGGKQSLEVYFSRYRDGRYWNSVKDILKD